MNINSSWRFLCFLLKIFIIILSFHLFIRPSLPPPPSLSVIGGVETGFCPGTYYVDQVGFEFTEIPPAGIKECVPLYPATFMFLDYVFKPELFGIVFFIRFSV